MTIVTGPIDYGMGRGGVEVGRAPTYDGLTYLYVGIIVKNPTALIYLS